MHKLQAQRPADHQRVEDYRLIASETRDRR